MQLQRCSTTTRSLFPNWSSMKLPSLKVTNAFRLHCLRNCHRFFFFFISHYYFITAEGVTTSTHGLEGKWPRFEQMISAEADKEVSDVPGGVFQPNPHQFPLYTPPHPPTPHPLFPSTPGFYFRLLVWKPKLWESVCSLALGERRGKAGKGIGAKRRRQTTSDGRGADWLSRGEKEKAGMADWSLRSLGLGFHTNWQPQSSVSWPPHMLLVSQPLIYTSTLQE